MSRYRYSGRHRHRRGGLVHVADMFTGALPLRTGRRRRRWPLRLVRAGRTAAVIALPVPSDLGTSVGRAA